MKRSFIVLTALLSVFSTCEAFGWRSDTQTDTMNVVTANVKSPVAVTVVVPESCVAVGDTARYPVVYLLHGYSDDYTGYAAKMPLDSLANHYGVIFVCPDGRNSWYWNSPEDSKMQMESFITSDLVEAVDRRLPTIADRNHRAVAGLSMGGHGAMWIAMRHKDLFAHAGSMSGGLDFDSKRFEKSFEIDRWLGDRDAHRDRWRSHTAKSLIPTLLPGELNLIVVCGDSDFFIDVNNDFHRALCTRGISHAYIVSPGNHSWFYWRMMLPRLLDYFNLCGGR